MRYSTMLACYASTGILRTVNSDMCNALLTSEQTATVNTREDLISEILKKISLVIEYNQTQSSARSFSNLPKRYILVF